MATIDPHASAGFHRSSDDEINVEEIEAHTFQPSMNYITQSIAELDVASFLEQTRYKVPVYMTTGPRIAPEEHPRAATAAAADPSMPPAGVDLPIDGAQVGPSGKFTKGQGEHGFIRRLERLRCSAVPACTQRVRFSVVKDGIGSGIGDRATCVKGAEMMLEDDDEATQGPEAPESSWFGGRSW